MRIDEIYEQISEDKILLDIEVISKEEYRRRIMSMYYTLIQQDMLDEADLILEELNQDDIITESNL